MAAAFAEAARREALRDDRDAFSVVMGARLLEPTEEGNGGADENVKGKIKDIVLDNFSVSTRGKELLRGASLRISHGQRYGLVPVPKSIDVPLVEQEIASDDRPAIETVVAADTNLTALRADKASLEAASCNDDCPDKIHEQLAKVYEQLADDEDAAYARAAKILAGLGFNQAMQSRPTKSFSGGWRMRISLARAWKDTLVVVSHDRDFLNTVCNSIIHLHDRSLHLYRGNFNDFESRYEQRRKEANKKAEVYDKQMKAARKIGSKAAQDKVKGQALSKANKEVAKSKGKGEEHC
ncbi:hypothetical protein ACQ4PT_033001 [Festuca glaucescens]